MKITFTPAALLFAGLTFAAPLAAQEPKLRMAVMEFTEKGAGRWSGHVGTATEDWFIDELVNTKKFRVMERGQLTQLLNEQSFQLSGAVDQQTAVKAGRLLGVQLVVFGNIDFAEKKSSAHTGGLGGLAGGRLGGVWGGGSKKTSEGNLTARVVNVTTGEIMFSKSETISDSSMNISIMGTGGGSDWDETKVRKVFQPAVKKVVEELVAAVGELKAELGDAATAVEGKVVMMKEGKVYINLGKLDGVKPGESYDVVRADIITDPDSGQELGREEKKIGRITIDKIGGDHLAICRPESGTGFEKGDIVKRK